MKVTTKCTFVAAVALAVLGGGWMYLHSPAPGRPCASGQGARADNEGKLFVCQDGVKWQESR